MSGHRRSTPEHYESCCPCPCCGLPTIGELGCDEICGICWWHDDGQNDDSADEVWGGPNRHYSLTDARRNFRDHNHMFDIGKGIDAVENPSPARIKLLNYVNQISAEEENLNAATLRTLMDALFPVINW